MASPAPKDDRGFYILPQGYEGGGYYVYGTPRQGAAQYAHPLMISVILSVAGRWTHQDWRKFGVGNLSLANGVKFGGHDSHRSGLEVDVRPIRKEGKNEPCRWGDQQYDFEATKRLITLFMLSGRVDKIYFNDLSIPGVWHLGGHDNHFHVEILNLEIK